MFENDAFKAYFLGPRSENESWMRSEIQGILDYWFAWRKSLFSSDPEAIPFDERIAPEFLAKREQFARELNILNENLRSELPKYTPRYMGHMVSELSLPATMGHFVALLHNPNNTNREGSRVGLAIEEEAIAMLAEMIGFDPAKAAGHFTSGGTVANFEAIWRARRRLEERLIPGLYLAQCGGEIFDPFLAGAMSAQALQHAVASAKADGAAYDAFHERMRNPYILAQEISSQMKEPYRGPVMLVPGNKHYSWTKGVQVFGLGEGAFQSIELDAAGRLDVDALEKCFEEARAERRPVMMVVSVAGTTEAGEIDPVDRVQDFLDGWKRRGVETWHHVDGAYGGYFCALAHHDDQALEPQARNALVSICRATSVTIDPHKLGYAPYACGAFLARDAEAYRVEPFKAPYLERGDQAPEKWASTLEGSRSAAGAAAAWLTGRTVGYGPDGLGRVLLEGIEARKSFCSELAKRAPFVRPITPADTNILCFSLADRGEPLSAANLKTNRVFESFHQSPNFSVSKTTFSMSNYRRLIEAHVARYDSIADVDELTLLRCVFMNPFWSAKPLRKGLQGEFIDELTTHYQRAA